MWCVLPSASATGCPDTRDSRTAWASPWVSVLTGGPCWLPARARAGRFCQPDPGQVDVCVSVTPGSTHGNTATGGAGMGRGGQGEGRCPGRVTLSPGHEQGRDHAGGRGGAGT